MTMANVNEMFPSRFFRAADVPKRGLTLVIENVTEEEVNGDGEGKQKKWALKFKNEDQLLVLNKTNGTILAEAFGPDTESWIGKAITLRTEKVSFGGRLTDGIRVAVVDFDDDIAM
jgi:hypothetical protein